MRPVDETSRRDKQTRLAAFNRAQIALQEHKVARIWGGWAWLSVDTVGQSSSRPT